MRQAKQVAAAQGRTLTALIEEGLRFVIFQAGKRRKAKRVVLPVSDATGGLHPGIDLTSFSAIQEMDDMAYMERMNRLK
jgi:hypothetical protein